VLVVTTGAFDVSS